MTRRSSIPKSSHEGITTWIEGKRHSRIQRASGPLGKLAKRFGRPDGKGGYRLGTDFSDRLALVKDNAAALLRSSGLPDVPDIYFTKSAPGRWQAQPPPDDDFKRRCSVDFYVRQRGFAKDSTEDLAARILVRATRMECNPADAPRLAFELGQLCVLMRIYATESAPGRKGGARGAATKRQHAAAWQAKIAADVKRHLAKGRSNSSIGVWLAGTAGRSPRTVAAYAASVRRQLGFSKESTK